MKEEHVIIATYLIASVVPAFVVALVSAYKLVPIILDTPIRIGVSALIGIIAYWAFFAFAYTTEGKKEIQKKPTFQ